MASCQAMAAEMVYQIARYTAHPGAETLIERFQIDDSAVCAGDAAAVIAADADLNEIRADRLTRITAAAEVEAALPLVLTAVGPGLLYVNGERWAAFPGSDGPLRLLPADGPAVALRQSWLRLSFTGTAGTVSGRECTELGLATPLVAVDAGGRAVRIWRRAVRPATPDGDAQVVLSWLRGNAVSDRVGADTDLLVQLFIEAAAAQGRRRSWDGEFLATLTGSAECAGATADSEWNLTVDLAPDVVEAVLAGIADSDPRWRYAIVAASDPESPAGRVRRAILEGGIAGDR